MANFSVNLDSFAKSIASVVGYTDIYSNNTAIIDAIKKEVESPFNIELFFTDIQLKNKMIKYYSANNSSLPKKYGKLTKIIDNTSLGYETLTSDQKTDQEWFYYEAPSDCFLLISVKEQDSTTTLPNYFSLALSGIDLYTYYLHANNIINTRASELSMFNFLNNRFVLQKYNGDFQYRSNYNYDDFFIKYVALSIDIILPISELKFCYMAWFVKRLKDIEHHIIKGGTLKDLEFFGRKANQDYKYRLAALNQKFSNI